MTRRTIGTIALRSESEVIASIIDNPGRSHRVEIERPHQRVIVTFSRSYKQMFEDGFEVFLYCIDPVLSAWVTRRLAMRILQALTLAPDPIERFTHIVATNPDEAKR